MYIYIYIYIHICFLINCWSFKKTFFDISRRKCLHCPSAACVHAGHALYQPLKMHIRRAGGSGASASTLWTSRADQDQRSARRSARARMRLPAPRLPVRIFAEFGPASRNRSAVAAIERACCRRATCCSQGYAVAVLQGMATWNLSCLPWTYLILHASIHAGIFFFFAPTRLNKICNTFVHRWRMTVCYCSCCPC